MIDIAKIVIPQALENMTLPSPELVNFYTNLEKRILWLDSEVDDNWLEYSRFILNWNAEDKRNNIKIEDRMPIRLMFYSYGGDLDINNHIIDIVRMSKTPVWGVNVGLACSAACFIFLACHKRYAMPNSSFLIHQGGGEGFSGTYEQVVSLVIEYQRKIENLAKYLQSTTKIPEATLEERISTEWYITAQEAIEYGICDSIVTDLDDIL